MINQESRRLDAEKIRQEFIKSTRLKLPSRPPVPRAMSMPQPQPQPKPLQ
jgi:hypothetical protein